MKSHHFIIVILVSMFIGISNGYGQQTAEQLYQSGLYKEEIQGEMDAAVKIYEKIINQYPDNRQVAAKTLYHLGLVSEKMGKQKADAYFRRLVNTYPDQTEMVTLAKARIAQFASSTTEATMKAEQSFKLASDLFKQFKYESAVAEYEKVIKLAPKSQQAQEAQLWIGQCYFKQGKNDQALKSFNALVKEFPGSTIIPVTEMMISQVQQTIPKEPKKSSVISLDDKTILDTNTGVKYTKINTWAGKYDVIKSASSISDIFPNRKFLLSENKIIPFDNSSSYTQFDTLGSFRKSSLSPDGTRIAYFSKNGISVINVSPESGRPTGPAQKLLDKQYQYGLDINWSPDGNNLIFSLQAEEFKFSIWTLSTKDGSLTQVTNPFIYALYNGLYSKNGSNILYKKPFGNGVFAIIMKSIVGKSISILDSCDYDKFLLSPDNQWILYNKKGDKKMLFRMADKQQQELSTPEEVGDFVSWADEGKKVFFYSQSSEEKNVIKVASILGGPAFELGKEYYVYPLGWSPNSNELFVLENGKNSKPSLKMINLTNQTSSTMDSIESTVAYPYLSPDRSMVLVRSSGRDLSIVPVSWKDSKVNGKPILIFKGFQGMGADISWSPNGKKLAVCNGGEVWICNTEGGTPLQLTSTPIIENFPSWSPDGNIISVYVRSTNQLQILKSSDGEVLTTYEKVNNWAWTPDGKEITIAFKDGQLSTVSLVSGKSRKIANWKEISRSSGLNDLIYSPDGKWIAINGCGDEPGSKTHTFLINVVDGKATEFAVNDEESKENIKWSPDSKWISYSSYGTKKTRLESILWEADLTDFMNKIKPGTEIGYTTDFDFKTLAIPAGGVPPDGTFTDVRDSHIYKYKKIGNQTWMAENLAYLPEVSPDTTASLVDKRFYVYGYKDTDVQAAKNTENYQKFGVLYNWKATMNGASGSNSVPSGVQGICPAGWHLPSDAEWMVLEKTLGMSEADLVKDSSASRPSGSVDKKLKSPFEWEDDDIFIGQSGFNALPGGAVGPVGPRVKSTMKNGYAFFQSSTLSNDRPIIRDIYVTLFFRGPVFGKDWAVSVRCVKD